MTLEDVNTIEQVAEYLHLEPRKVRQLVRQGRIGSRKEGKTVTIDREDVDEYRRVNRREPVAPNPFGLTDSAMRRVRSSSP